MFDLVTDKKPNPARRAAARLGAVTRCVGHEHIVDTRGLLITSLR
jgi:hypothetical protein